MAIAEAVPTRSDAVDVYEEETRRYERSPRDALRLAVFGLVTIFTLVLALWLQDSVLGFEQSVIQLFNFLSPTVERVINGGLEWFTALVGVALLAVPLTTKRYRLFWYVLLAVGLAALLMSGVVWLLEHHHPDELLNQIADRCSHHSNRHGEPSGVRGTHRGVRGARSVRVGALAAGGGGDRPGGPRAGAVHRRLLPAGNVVVSIPSAPRVGAGVLLAFGRPDRRPTVAAIAALGNAGLPVRDLGRRESTPGPRPRTSRPSRTGRGMFVKVLGEYERAADLMYRVYRYLRLKDVGDDRPFSSLRRTVEHEALVSLVARDIGVRTPRMPVASNSGSTRCCWRTTRSTVLDRRLPDAA